MPVTVAPKCSAACSDSEPHPQPTSSSVVPGSRPSLRQTSDSLSCCACSTDTSGDDVVAAGVGHLRVEDQRVELVGEVVVEADRPPVSQLAVQPTLDLRLRRGCLRGRSDHSEARERAECAGDDGRRRATSREASLGHDGPHVGQGLVEVPSVDRWHVELAGHVGLGCTELARTPEQAADGVRRVEHHERTVHGPGLRAVPRAQPHRQLATDERLEDLGEPGGDAVPARGAGPRAGAVAGLGHAGRRNVSWLTSM